MRRTAHLGFRVGDGEIRGDILVPRYYDPEIEDLLNALTDTHELVSIGELIASGQLELRQGKYIGKLHYGTGRIPYIRTSDLANGELRASPKHGVSEAVWAEYHGQQDVRPGDVLLVHEGTYLIGTCAPVTRYDLPLLFQHHLAKLRVASEAPLTGPLLAAAIGAPIVQRQIRAKQLTADIIDSIVGRLQEVVLPVPRDTNYRSALASECVRTYDARAEARSRLSLLIRRIEASLLTGDPDPIRAILADEIGEAEPMALLGERIGFRSFRYGGQALTNDVLIPAYYDPTIARDLEQLAAAGCELVSVRELADSGVISLETGDEVGKLAYGSGDIPFVRTSDLGTWELKLDPKQRVSRAVYDSLAGKQSARPDDVLVVRDGTYLVGSAAMVGQADVPLLFSGGIYRVRVERPSELEPHLLLALLWSPIVRRQIRAKRFTRDVIDTLGHRFEEIILPIPAGAVRNAITDTARELMETRLRLRKVVGDLGAALQMNRLPMADANVRE